jgi:hypothetical protein
MGCRWVCGAALLLGTAAWMVPVPEADAAPPGGVKTITLSCSRGWRGSAVGQYGGIGFWVSCENGRARQRITGVTGTAYSTRVGVESDEVGADCFYSGDALTVNESCLQVRLSIR